MVCPISEENDGQKEKMNSCENNLVDISCICSLNNL